MTDGRCRFGPRAKREMVARLLAGEKGAGDRSLDGLLCDDGDDGQGPVAGGVGGRQGFGRLVCTAAAGAGVVSVAARSGG